MPRETIHTAPGDSPFEVKVGWSRDQDVQLGVVHRTGDKVGEAGAAQLLHQLFDAGQVGTAASEILGIRTDSPAELGYQVLSAVGATNPLMSSLWCDLNRHQINQLITVLRRARDAAYGRDA